MHGPRQRKVAALARSANGTIRPGMYAPPRDVRREIERMERTQGHRCTCGVVHDNSAMLPAKCTCGRSLHSHYWGNADRLITQLPPARGDYAGRVSVDGACPVCGTATDHGHPVCGCEGYSIARTSNDAAVFHADAAKRAGDRRSHWHQPGDGTLRDDRERRVLGATYYELAITKRGSKAKKIVRKPLKTHDFEQRASHALKVEESDNTIFIALSSIADTPMYQELMSWARGMERRRKAALMLSA